MSNQDNSQPNKAISSEDMLAIDRLCANILAGKYEISNSITKYYQISLHKFWQPLFGVTKYLSVSYSSGEYIMRYNKNETYFDIPSWAVKNVFDACEKFVNDEIEDNEVKLSELL